MEDKYRFDFVFSYWIFVWFILYYYKIILYSPLFALIIGLIYNIFLYLYLIYKYIKNKTSYNLFVLFDFIIVNFFIKILPLYYLIYVEKNNDYDIQITLLLFLLFIIWMFINRKIYINNYKLIIIKQSSTPIYNLLFYYYNYNNQI